MPVPAKRSVPQLRQCSQSLFVVNDRLTFKTVATNFFATNLLVAIPDLLKDANNQLFLVRVTSKNSSGLTQLAYYFQF